MPFRWATLRDSEAVRWLLDLEWAGRTYRLADEPCSAPTGEAGALERYEGGLDLGDYEDACDLWADESAPRTVSVTFYLPDLIDRLAAGCDLQSARGRLWIWADAGDERDCILVLDGVLREPEHGANEDPVTATLAEEEEDAGGLVPEDAAKYTATTWPGATGDVEQYGERYPIVIGRPGGGVVDGSHSLTVASGRLLICDRPVSATSVTVYDEEHGTSEVVAVDLEADSLGRMTSTLSAFAVIGDPPGTLVVGDPYWIRWDNGGGIMRGADEIRGAGAVLRWLLERSGARYDEGRVGAVVGYLDGYLIDGMIAASPEERVSPLTWLRDHLLPILPISLRIGPSGLYPVLWRWEATEAEAEVDADGGRAVRDGGVIYSSRSDVRNELCLQYRRDVRLDRYSLRVGLTGDPATTDTDLQPNLWCAASFLRYGRRVTEATTDVVADAATAARVLAWWARRYALPLRSATWRVSRRDGWIEPGTVVHVRDTEVAVDGLGLCRAVRWGRTDLAVDVAILPRLEGGP
jgi:hypothetical protein